jgi:sugar/nucleoside kinase (ribokinase family)
VVARPVERFTWGTTTWVEEAGQHLGGNGGNTSYALGMLGARVRLMGMVGDDASGERVLSILRSAGVDLSLVGRSRASTTTTIVLVHPSGERMFFHQVGSSVEVFPEPVEFTEDLLRGAARFHMANVYALPAMRRSAPETLRRAKAAGLATSLDTGWDARGRWLADLEGCLPHADLMFLNKDEARMLSGFDDPEQAARRMQSLGAGDVVIKLGAEGCAIYPRSGGVARVPGFRIDVVDTTGAGDCFVGGFLAGLMEGMNYEQAARLANAAGAMSASSLGAVTGMRNRAETQEWMRRASCAP